MTEFEQPCTWLGAWIGDQSIQIYVTGILLPSSPPALSDALEDAFRGSVQQLNGDGGNEDKSNASSSPPRMRTRVDAHAQFLLDQPFDAVQKTCGQMDLKVISLFGFLPSPSTSSAVASVASSMRIPFFSASASVDASSSSSSFVVRLGPSQRQLERAVADLVAKGLGWGGEDEDEEGGEGEVVALLRNEETGHLRTGRFASLLQRSGVSSVRLVELHRGLIRPDLVRMRREGVRKFVLDLGALLVKSFFEQALKAGIVTGDSTFVLTDLDFLSLDLGDVTSTGARIFGLGLAHPQSGGHARGHHASHLLHAGLRLLSSAVGDLTEGEVDLAPPVVSCKDREAPYNMGEDIMDAVLKTSLSASSPLRLTKSPRGGGLQRESVNLTVFMAREAAAEEEVSAAAAAAAAAVPVGRWEWSAFSTDAELTMSAADSGELAGDLSGGDSGSKGKKKKMRGHLVVYAFGNKRSPYFRPSSSSSSSPAVASGFLVDLLEKVSSDEGFTYELRESEHKGHLDRRTGNWTGILGRLVRREADLGLADFAVTSQRSRAVEFSVPYQVSHLTFLTKTHPSWESSRGVLSSTLLLSPFSPRVWTSVAASVVLTALLLALVARMSPTERASPAARRRRKDQRRYPHQLHHDGREEGEEEGSEDERGGGIGGVADAAWFVLFATVLRPFSAFPKAVGPRLLVFSWCSFCLGLILVYGVRLYYISTTGTSYGKQPIEIPSVETILQDDSVSIGVVHRMATWDMLKNSVDPLHRRVWRRVDKGLGLRRVVHGLAHAANGSSSSSKSTRTAFVAESVQADRLLSDRCDLSAVGDLGGHRYYALAFPRGSPHRRVFSAALARYSEDGSLGAMRERWMPRTRSDCKDAEGGGGSGGGKVPLDVDPFFLFLLLLLGASISLCATIIELICFALTRSRRSSQLSFCDCLCSELREIAPPPSSCSRAGDQSSSASSSSPSPPLQQRANGGGGGDDTSPNLLFRQTRALLTRGPGSSEEGGNSSEENSQL